MLSLYFIVSCPEISLSPSCCSILAEQSATFTCQAFSFGSIDYMWERDDNQMPSKAVIDVCSSTLTVPNGSQYDEGLYCCLVTNDFGTVKECAMLSVTGTFAALCLVWQLLCNQLPKVKLSRFIK